MAPELIPHEAPMLALLQFVADWVPELSDEHRMAASEIPHFVPPPLQALYQFAGNFPAPSVKQWRPPSWIPGLFGAQDHLLPPDQLTVVGERFRFLSENQGVWNCETLIAEIDPPVFSDSLTCEHGDIAFQQVCANLSHFLSTYCLQELVFGSSYLFSVCSEVKEPGDLVSSPVTPVWINGVYVYNEPTHSFWLCDGGLLIMKVGDEIQWLATNDEAQLLNISRQHAIRRVC